MGGSSSKGMITSNAIEKLYDHLESTDLSVFNTTTNLWLKILVNLPPQYERPISDLLLLKLKVRRKEKKVHEFQSLRICPTYVPKVLSFCLSEQKEDMITLIQLCRVSLERRTLATMHPKLAATISILEMFV